VEAVHIKSTVLQKPDSNKKLALLMTGIEYGSPEVFDALRNIHGERSVGSSAT
jgi:hypothetical protein